MTNEKVCKAFLRGESARSLNMHTDGVKLFSYYTVIAQWSNKKPAFTLLINETKYSSTTSKQMNYLTRNMQTWLDALCLKRVPMGAQDLEVYL